MIKSGDGRMNYAAFMNPEQHKPWFVASGGGWSLVWEPNNVHRICSARISSAVLPSKWSIEYQNPVVALFGDFADEVG